MTTEILVFIQAGLIGFAVIASILFLFFAELKVSNFIFAGCFITACLSIFGVVWLCKVFVDFIHRKLKVKGLTKYRNDYLIAFGAIGIFLVVLRILAYFSNLCGKTYLTTMFVYLISSPAIYYFFVFQTLGKKCRWIQMDEKTCFKLLRTNILVHIVLFIVSARIAVGYYDEETRTAIIAFQFIWSLISVLIFADFAHVLMLGVRLINFDEERKEVIKKSVELEKVKANNIPNPESTSKLVVSKPTCNICSFPYTETGIHTPRMIKECGHSVCEQCADKLLKSKGENFLLCPFCQKATIVNGPAGILPKNFALLEQMAEDPIRIV